MSFTQPAPNGPKNADEFLTMAHRMLPKLWHIHDRVGDREFRTFLNAAERLKRIKVAAESSAAHSDTSEGASN
jgi:hypothetical protein